jgi:acyl-CoA dehydrogenase
VRAFVASEQANGSFTPRSDSWLSGHSPEFSRTLGAKGWIGMTFPQLYGGAGKTALERFVVIEELLAAGAPVAAHWFGDRQVGPLILRYGNEAQRHKFLRDIARGECYFAIGMSEPDSGSDLASVRCAAKRVETGWRLTGRKVWTSHAHRSHYILVLCRTSGTHGDRHRGLSQLIVDMTAPGVETRPIRLITGDDHMCEVTFDDAFVPGSMLVGIEGDGWPQVMSELAFERSGPERVLSTYPLLEEALTSLAGSQKTPGPALGAAIARLTALRRLSLSVAIAVDAGDVPALQAAIVKEVGTRFERDLVNDVRLEVEPEDRSPALSASLSDAILHAPGFTLRGGTSEILCGIIAKALLPQ